MSRTYREFREEMKAKTTQVCIPYDLAEKCLDLLEEAIWHDGRYGQNTRKDWQLQAFQAATRLLPMVGRVPFERQKDPEQIEAAWREAHRLRENPLAEPEE